VRFFLTPGIDVCIITTEHENWISNTHSSIRPAGLGRASTALRNETKAAGPIGCQGLAGATLFMQNEPNSLPFWANNADRAEKRSQTNPIGPAGTERLVAMDSIVRNKANYRVLGAENADYARKTEPIKPNSPDQRKATGHAEGVRIDGWSGFR